MDRIKKKTHTHTNVYTESSSYIRFLDISVNLIILAFCQYILSKTNTNGPTASFKYTYCDSEAKL